MGTAITSLLLLLALPAVLDSFPNGAGSCGKNAIMNAQGPHSFLPNLGGGELAGNFHVLLDSIQVLDVNKTNQVMIGVNHDIQILGANSSFVFRGFLIRLEGDSDITKSLSTINNDANVQVAATECIIRENVGGLTHTNREDKESIHGEMNLLQVGRYVLDVTVVVSTEYNQ